ncbi:MAG: SDR family NAD(P)-dependent oxidoreductase, partial [Pseudomonadota bacterium]
MNKNPVAVVTGGNRGMGLATCRGLADLGHSVILCSRNTTEGEQQAASMRDAGLDVRSVELDVLNPDHISALVAHLESDHQRVDVLVNNAGILNDGSSDTGSIFDADIEAVELSFRVNTAAPLALTKALLPMMQARDYGRVVNVSTGK